MSVKDKFTDSEQYVSHIMGLEYYYVVNSTLPSYMIIAPDYCNVYISIKYLSSKSIRQVFLLSRAVLLCTLLHKCEIKPRKLYIVV
jgi:hypothetical protein